ncbi:MAG: HPr(Ser) kinase/phosphatase [Candidatus Aminicenantes bacterium]|nr:MAG: HPr(Ser) kinase/phosphatase [Candidatus Aminicenantes bacterium]
MIKNKKGTEVNAIIEQSDLEILKVYNEKWTANKIFHSGAQKPGLALAGYFKYLDKERIQVFGKTEIGYLMHLPRDDFEKCLKDFMAMRVPCIIVSENQEVDEFIISTARKNRVPILISGLKTSLLIPRLINFLYRYFSEKIKINGVMMDIMGLGILITGPSGIGKSETALELVGKGSHLISDDLVEFYLNANEEVVGRSIDKIKKWIEVRGLGIINIVEMFGVGALLEEKKLDLVISLEKWNPRKKYDRLGEGNLDFEILGKHIPMFNLPVAVGRNPSTLIEVAVKYFISRKNGSVSFVEHMYQTRNK